MDWKIGDLKPSLPIGPHWYLVVIIEMATCGPVWAQPKISFFMFFGIDKTSKISFLTSAFMVCIIPPSESLLFETYFINRNYALGITWMLSLCFSPSPLRGEGRGEGDYLFSGLTPFTGDATGDRDPRVCPRELVG